MKKKTLNKYPQVLDDETDLRILPKTTLFIKGKTRSKIWETCLFYFFQF